MLFNSIDFLLFLAVVLALVHLTKPTVQKWVLLTASCFFYAYWDWRFLGLLFLTSFIDYVCAQCIEASNSPHKRRMLLGLSLGGNLAILGYFKYCNFFLDNLRSVFSAFGFEPALSGLHVVLPIGISFYTFQAMSYTVDVYRGHATACRNLRDFFLYITFFPQLAAGPIERASAMLPQLTAPRRVTRVDIIEGAYLVLWGFCKKTVVADNLSAKVDRIFSQSTFTANDVVLGTLGFAFQIYADFSGYTDIARGVARWLGVRLTLNFDHPYFASSPQDFWRRWHISLSTWLREYIYIPLGGNRLGAGRTYLNLMATMLLGGLWHGAAWNFILWGGYQGMLLAVSRACTEKVWKRLPARGQQLWRWCGGVATFVFVLYGWLLFRAHGLGQLTALHQGLFTGGFSVGFFGGLAKMLPYIALILFVDVATFKTRDPFLFARLSTPLTVLFYLALLYAILIFGVTGGEKFIYFAF